MPMDYWKVGSHSSAACPVRGVGPLFFTGGDASDRLSDRLRFCSVDGMLQLVGAPQGCFQISKEIIVGQQKLKNTGPFVLRHVCATI